MTMTSLPAQKQGLLSHIGNTPLVRLERVLPKSISDRIEVYAKLESFNPGGSVKDRPALKMIKDGFASGAFKSGQTLIDSTSGNTGIAYAMIGAVMGFSVELVMPTNVSEERKKILKAYGAKSIYSDPLKGSDGARELVCEIVKAKPEKYFFPDQYSNPSNWKAHYETTGPEIWRDTQGRVTHFVAGMGTSGTMMGTGRFLKEKNPQIQIVALEPEPFHGIEGWKNMGEAIPVKIYDSKVHDQKMTVPTEPAYHWARQLAVKEGIFVGPSAGGNFFGALSVMEKIKQGVVVMIFPDGGDKYLSTQLWEGEGV